MNENQQRKIKRHEKKIRQRFGSIEMLSPTETEAVDGSEVMRVVSHSLRRPNKVFPINPQTANRVKEFVCMHAFTADDVHGVNAWCLCIGSGGDGGGSSSSSSRRACFAFMYFV